MDGEINEVYGVCTGVMLCLKGIKVNGRGTGWMDRWIDEIHGVYLGFSYYFKDI